MHFKINRKIINGINISCCFVVCFCIFITTVRSEVWGGDIGGGSFYGGYSPWSFKPVNERMEIATGYRISVVDISGNQYGKSVDYWASINLDMQETCESAGIYSLTKKCFLDYEKVGNKARVGSYFSQDNGDTLRSLPKSNSLPKYSIPSIVGIGMVFTSDEFTCVEPFSIR